MNNENEMVNRLAALENQVKNNTEMLIGFDTKLDLIIKLEQKLEYQQKELEQLRKELEVQKALNDANRKELAEWEFLRKTSGWIIGIFSTLGIMVFGWWLNKH